MSMGNMDVFVDMEVGMNSPERTWLQNNLPKSRWRILWIVQGQIFPFLFMGVR